MVRVRDKVRDRVMVRVRKVRMGVVMMKDDKRLDNERRGKG